MRMLEGSSRHTRTAPSCTHCQPSVSNLPLALGPTTTNMHSTHQTSTVHASPCTITAAPVPPWPPPCSSTGWGAAAGQQQQQPLQQHPGHLQEHCGCDPSCCLACLLLLLLWCWWPHLAAAAVGKSRSSTPVRQHDNSTVVQNNMAGSQLLMQSPSHSATQPLSHSARQCLRPEPLTHTTPRHLTQHPPCVRPCPKS